MNGCRLALTLALLPIGLLACRTQADDLPPGVANTQNPEDISLTPSESLARISVPPGFHVTLFAGEPAVRRPIAFDFDDRGRLWVVENYSHPVCDESRRVDRVLIFTDTDNDGPFDQRKLFWDQGRFLTGIAYGFGGIFLCDPPELIFVPDADGDDQPDGPHQVLLDGFSLQNINNVINNLIWAPDGWLWGCVGVGGKSRVGVPGMPDHLRQSISRGIWRFHPTERRFEVLAQGPINPWGVDFDDHGDAFNTNTVSAHLWHLVPGSYYERRHRERDNPYVYSRMQSIADHLHWGGGHWTDSRGGAGKHSVAGGGHAHTAAMIYLGDNWPQQYRGGFFTGNLHGNRINHDKLTPRRSTYVGTHEADVLTCSDEWFRPLGLKYGPDGGVFVSDWHDYGECHDNDGSHRTSGRIFKITFGKPSLAKFNLAAMSDGQLAELMRHQNDWYVRHARRLLQERALAGSDTDAADRSLRKMICTAEDRVRLRAIWALGAMGRLSDDDLVELLDDESSHVRWWAVRLLADRESDRWQSLVALAAREPSPRVRLEIAAAMPRVGGATTRVTAAIAKALLAHSEDANDPVIPLMIWFGLEPIVTELGPTALEIGTSMQLVRRFITRRLLEHDASLAGEIIHFTETTDPAGRLAILHGFRDALENGTSVDVPEGWAALYRAVHADGSAPARSVATAIALALGDKEILAKYRKQAADPTSGEDERLVALESLLGVDRGVSTKLLHVLVGDASRRLRLKAIRALASRSEPKTPDVLLKSYAQFDSEARWAAVEVMTSRAASARLLLDQLVSGKIERRDVSAFALRQLRSFKDAEIQEAVEMVFGQPLAHDKEEQLRRYRALLTPDYLAHADPGHGRTLFAKTCAKCHTLFGDGGDLGPDLTGSQRASVDYLLQNLVDPSALVDESYRLTIVISDEGQLHTGFLISQDDHELTLRTLSGKITFATKEIESIETSAVSMMPDGMLEVFTNQELRDLFVYLGSAEQVEVGEPSVQGGG